MSKKTAVILLNLGGPSTQDEIPSFLFSLFYDRAILSLPNPFRYVLAKVFAWYRSPKTRQIYAHLGGGSPLLKNTSAQAKALNEILGKGYRVFVAMRHAPPLSQETFESVRAYSPDEIVLLPLYPQYSTTTTESSFKAWIEIAQKGKVLPTRVISSYPSEEGFLEALKDLTLPCYKRAQKFGTPHVLLAAHGLPEKTIQRGDPYEEQVKETAKKLREKLQVSDITLCYQSRVGPSKWMSPFLDDEIQKASRKRRPLVVVPISFVSEHSETLVELDITLKKLALREGCPHYERVPTVHTHPLFIKGLASLVRQSFLS